MTDKNDLKARLERASCRILLVGDLHLRDTAPRNALPSYPDDLFDLLETLSRLDSRLKADATIFAGDIFDHKAPSKTSHRLILKTLRALKQFERPLIVAGNHDISFDRLETIQEQQPLGVLFEAGIEELNGWDRSLPVFGVPWQQHWSETLSSAFEDWRNSTQSSEGALAVTHASIFPPGKAPQQFESLHPSDIAEAMAHRGSLYYGHIHDWHGVYEVDGVTFCNPGALSRGSLTESNVTRSIKAALWTPEDGFIEIDLPSKTGEEVFRIEEAAAVKLKEAENEQFLAEIGSTRLDVSSTAGVISYIESLDEEKAPAPVKKASIELIETASPA